MSQHQRPTPGYAFGYGNRGALGITSTATAVAPVPVDLPVDTVRVVGGTGFTLALTADGDVWAWGDHRRGQLGPAASGANLGERVQITITGGHPVVAIDAANDHAIAVTADGRSTAGVAPP